MERSLLDPPLVGKYRRIPRRERMESGVESFGRLLDGELKGQTEEIAKVIARERDPAVAVILRRMSDRVAFAREVLEFVADPWQEVALRSSARRIILNCNRQWGKSTIAAIRALHRAWFWPGSTILFVSRAHAQSGGLLEKVRGFLPYLGANGRWRGDGVNRISVKLPNGSRIIALPGGDRPMRSYSKVSLVVIDEAAMVPDAVHDAVTPTLGTTNGDLMLLSTPMGKRGAFYRTWAFGGDEWERVFGPVDLERPGRIAREHLESERRRGGEDFFAQEYLCEFLDRDSHLFGEDSLRDLFSRDFTSWE
jgi:hypothetical protein